MHSANKVAVVGTSELKTCDSRSDLIFHHKHNLKLHKYAIKFLCWNHPGLNGLLFSSSVVSPGIFMHQKMAVCGHIGYIETCIVRRDLTAVLGYNKQGATGEAPCH